MINKSVDTVIEIRLHERDFFEKDVLSCLLNALSVYATYLSKKTVVDTTNVFSEEVFDGVTQTAEEKYKHNTEAMRATQVGVALKHLHIIVQAKRDISVKRVVREPGPSVKKTLPEDVEDIEKTFDRVTGRRSMGSRPGSRPGKTG